MTEIRDRLLRIDQVMQILNCSRSWAYRLCREGKLQLCILGQGKKQRKGYRVRESSLQAFIQGQLQEFYAEDE